MSTCNSTEVAVRIGLLASKDEYLNIKKNKVLQDLNFIKGGLDALIITLSRAKRGTEIEVNGSDRFIKLSGRRWRHIQL